MTHHSSSLSSTVRHDIASGLVVALVALPLCLGIALASGAPLISGIIAGIVGGICIGILSGSHVSVSGPAAGLTVIVLHAITTLGSFERFLAAVLVAGGIQMLFGVFKLGVIANYIPISVIQGMLAAIGVVIILKQIPHALGRDVDFEGDFSFSGIENYSNTLNELLLSITHPTAGACIISALSFLILGYWERVANKIHRAVKLIPSSLVAVIVAVVVNQLFKGIAPSLYLAPGSSYLVRLPEIGSHENIFSILPQIDFQGLLSGAVWLTGITLAVVASIETLLSLEAADKLDLQRRISPPNRELFSQGVGNVVSSLLGGLPVTSVVVRTSANINAGSRSKFSSIIHGILLLVSLLFIPHLLNLVPLSALAAVLLMVGYKLCAPRNFKNIFRAGFSQYFPFLVTITAVVFTDLLTGVIAGLIVGVFFVLYSNHKAAFTLVHQDNMYLLVFNKDVSFLNKSELKEKLAAIPEGAHLIIDGTKSLLTDFDIRDIVNDFRRAARYKRIHLETKRISLD